MPRWAICAATSGRLEFTQRSHEHSAELIVLPELAISGYPPEIEAVLEVLGLGTRDDCRKCGSERAVIAFSGEIDSSVVAVIAA